MKRFLLILTILFSANVLVAQKKQNKRDEPLLLVSKDDKYAYVNIKGDTIIPLGKYQMCYTETFADLAIVASNGKLIGIDRKENPLFEVFIFDNGPDDVTDGLFRIVKNKKIGFADEHGHIVIQPTLGCAYPFEMGKAMVSDSCKVIIDGEHKIWQSRKWYYIDKSGKKIEN